MADEDDSIERGPPQPVDDRLMFNPMDWICRHCGHHQPLTENGLPDKCEKCGMSGPQVAV
jgi:hypothetical protein